MPLSTQLQAAFDTNLMAELGFDDLPTDEKMKMLETMGEIINKNIALRMFEELPDERAKELKTLLTSYADDPEKLEFFFRQELPNFDEIVKEEVALYKQDLLDKFDKDKK
ncbi:MAG: hypothetical protein G01um101429_838 [Parcubacteria group bacterium Gr01-1014_29]|nr:MAG: hypothetical protein G01um101429_838 [Parcubacteria group bacterium Gr01-1014_29]